MPLYRREIRNRDPRPVMASDAEVALERLQELDLAAKHGALGHAMWMDAEVVAMIAKAGIGPDLRAAYSRSSTWALDQRAVSASPVRRISLVAGAAASVAVCSWP